MSSLRRMVRNTMIGCVATTATVALAQGTPVHEHQGASPGGAQHAGAAPSYPYPLGTCPVSGEKLGDMGDPVIKVYEGREVRFCCSKCVDTFEADTDGYWKKIDEQIVKQQLPHYPLDTCVVMKEDKLGGEGEPVNYVYNNRLVRLCCKGCIEDLNADPAKYMAELDRAIIEAQLKDYPLSTCPVSGGELGKMGDPVNYVYMNRLVRFCCPSCPAKFEADPAAFMEKLDKAYADAQRDSYPLDTCVVSGEELGGMGEPVEIVAGNRLVRFCCKGCIAKFNKEPGKFLKKIADAKGGSN